jgi:hypothetical protein
MPSTFKKLTKTKETTKMTVALPCHLMILTKDDRRDSEFGRLVLSGLFFCSGTGFPRRFIWTLDWRFLFC